MKNWIQKISDWGIEAFGLVFTLFICSIALPLAFGIMLLLAGIFYGLGNWFMDLSLEIKIPVSLTTGIILTIWLYKNRNKGSKEKESVYNRTL